MTPDPRRPDAENALVRDPGCARCPALVGCRTEIAWGNGPRDAALVVVGEAPAAGDPDADRWRGGNLTGLAYTSRHSGRRVRTLVAALGLGGRAFYTNAVKCFPCAGSEAEGEAGVEGPRSSDGADPASATNREPTDAERAACRDHLLAEVRTVAPDAILATGKHATASLLAAEGRSLDGFLDLVATVLDCPTVGAPVVPALHPSYEAVWRSRLGYDAAGYRAALADALRTAGVAGVRGDGAGE
ncbi:MAG: uracil-DNA glycosylase family protein [Haloferacaceae archaeon]